MSASMRILDIPRRPDPRLVAEFAKMVTPHLSDSMERLYAGGPQLRPMHREGKLAGPAFTVKTAAGDNLLVHKALDSARPGDVIVVDAGDIIVGDADGLVAVPQEMAERVLASAKAILEKETASMKQILAGTVDRGWVDKALKEKGYRI